MILYTYWRSSAAYRVRVALNLKGLDWGSAFVHLVRDGGQQLKEAFEALNPQRQVPVLDLEDGNLLRQSLAIIEYLDEAHPEPPLLPQEPLDRARVRALAQVIACDIHPLNNLRVLKYLTGTLGVDEERKTAWYRHWVATGFTALERLLAESESTGMFCHGNTPTIADVCLVPQVYNARRFRVDMSAFPNISRIDSACLELDAFAEAAPEAQGDAHV